MFGWFKKDEDADDKRRYDRRQFLRGSFIRDAFAERAEAADDRGERGDAEPADEQDELPPDLLGLLSQIDPNRADRQPPPGFGPPADDAPADPAQPGIATLQRRSCLAYNRSFCTVCAERCPVDGAIVVERGKPRIIAANCTGCGICQDVCPAPMNAIVLMSNPNRDLP